MRVHQSVRVCLSILVIISSVHSEAASNPSVDLCVSAVARGKAYIEARQHIAMLQKEDASLSQTQYQLELQALEEQAQWLSMQSCLASTGEQWAVFQCLAETENDISHCIEN